MIPLFCNLSFLQIPLFCNSRLNQRTDPLILQLLNQFTIPDCSLIDFSAIKNTGNTPTKYTNMYPCKENDRVTPDENFV